MKLLVCLLMFAVAAMSQAAKPYYDINDAPSLFEKFMKDYNRNYKDEADKDVHYQEFVKTLIIINKANAESSSATFDINNFADYTPEERKHLFGLKMPESLFCMPINVFLPKIRGGILFITGFHNAGSAKHA